MSVLALVRAVRTPHIIHLVREARNVDFNDALHPRDNEGKFRTVFNRVNRALSAWANSGGRDGERPISDLKLSRPSLIKVARKMGYEPKRGESDESIEDGILAKAREIDANRGDGPKAGGEPEDKRVVLTDAQHELLSKAAASPDGVIDVDKSDPDVKALADHGYLNLDRRTDRAEITGRGELKLKLPRESKGAPEVPAKKAAPRKTGRRNPAAVDPLAAFRDGGEEGLRQQLADLDVEQLRDVVADYGMDPARVSARWKDRDRIADLIVDRVSARSAKGQQFYPPKKAAPKPERPSTVAELEAELDSLSTPTQKRARLRKYGYSPAEIDGMVPIGGKAKSAPRESVLGGNMDEAERVLHTKTPAELKAIADEFNISMPAPAKSKEARIRHLLQSIDDASRRSGRIGRHDLLAAANRVSVKPRGSGDVGAAAARVRSASTPMERVAILDADSGLTPAKLRDVASELGVDLPPRLTRRGDMILYISEHGGYSPSEIDSMVPLKAKGAPKTKAAKQQFLADLIDAELAKPGLDDRAVTGAASPRELLKDLSKRLRAGEDDFENGWRAVADHMAVRYGNTGDLPESRQITDAFARIDSAYKAQVPTRAPRMPRAPLRERPPAKLVPPRPKVDLSSKAQSTMDRLQSFDDPPSRPEAHDLLKDMSRDDLKAMAKDLSVPNSQKMSMAKLRDEIVEATAGRRLDSRAWRGFAGRRIGDDLPKA